MRLKLHEIHMLGGICGTSIISEHLLWNTYAWRNLWNIYYFRASINVM